MSWKKAKEMGVRVFAGKITMGFGGDSYYEHLLKQWLQTRKSEAAFKDMWKDAMSAMMKTLVKKTKGGLTYLAMMSGHTDNYMDHGACFVPGMLALGAHELPEDEVDSRWMEAAADLTRTCYEMC